MPSVRNIVLMLSFAAAAVVCGQSIPAHAQPRGEDVPAGSYALIPTPRNIDRQDGSFTFTKDVVLVPGRTGDAEDSFAASMLRNELRASMGVMLSGTRKASSRSILIGRIGRDAAVRKALPATILSVVDSLGDEGYVVQITPARIIIAGNTGTGVFYGVQTLKQLIRANASGHEVPCMTIVDWPGLRYRGVMLDISRGPIPTMAYLKEIIATLAEYKQNSLTLYTEHVFRLRSHPDVAPADGITPEQVAELAAVARLHHIELIGNAQPFGHMENTLAIPFYRPMAENAWVVSPAVEKTYDYLKDVFAEIVPSYESRLFHINSDEVSGLGDGPARRMVDSMGAGGVYAYHIGRVDALVKPYGKRLMMWGDIAVNNPQIIDRLPKDLIIVSWGYHLADSFDDAILPFKKTGFDFMVAPGVNCWGNVWPNMSVASVNISNYVRDGAALGTMGMMNTVWVDDGENLGAYNWHGLLWGAECSWSPARPLKGEAAKEDLRVRSRAFDRSFDALFFGAPDVAATLYRFDSLRSMPIRGIVTDGAVWTSMLEIYPGEVDAAAVALNERVVREAAALRSALEILRAKALLHKEVLDAAVFAADRVAFTGKKNIVRAELAKTMRSPTGSNIIRTKELMRELFEELHGLKNTYAVLWDRENRGWWRDRVLAKYDRLGAQLLDLDKLVLIEKDTTGVDGVLRVRCTTPFGDQEIRYTTDGAEPTMRSAVSAGPFVLDRSSMIKACVFTGKKAWPVAEKHFLVHRAIGRLTALHATYSTYDPAYAAGGPLALTDGLRGSDDFKDGRWQGYQGQDVEAIMDLSEQTEIHRISMGFLQASYSWILMPSRVQFWISADGREYALAGEAVTTVDQKEDGTVVRDFAAAFSGVKGRFVKVIAKNPGPLPAWHQAAGGESFLFADEIVVE